MKKDSLVIDTGVLIELFNNSHYGNSFEEHFLKDLNIKYYYISPLTHSELLYHYCRKLGHEDAIKMLDEKLEYIIILNEEDLRYSASKLKCKYAIALADCYSIASGELKDCKVIMKREKEMDLIDLSELPAQVIFIDDFIISDSVNDQTLKIL